MPVRDPSVNTVENMVIGEHPGVFATYVFDATFEAVNKDDYSLCMEC